MAGRIYLHKTEPEKYPDYNQRIAPAVTRGALENRIQFTSLRGFRLENALKTDTSSIESADSALTRHNPQSDVIIVNAEDTIDMYVRHFGLGKVLWPVYPTLFAKNFDSLVELCKREGLFMFDFWGYVPGSKASGSSIWGEYAIPQEADDIMRELLGDRFLGYDNGEQDGRYVGGYARTAAPLADCRRAQYKNFQHHFEKLLGDMRNHTVTLASLTFLHYFAKEGNSIMLGAETAQALPSSPMWFSFIRGAGKQYGLLFFGNASVWNRWGYKDYIVDAREPDTSNGYEMGRFAGTSLGLLKRLIYNHYMYNCDILGFENAWLKSEEASKGEENTPKSYVLNGKRNVLTPIGEIQRGCANFAKRYPDPGVMYTPLAIIADFFAGWVPPRHLYTGDIYKVWGNLPYNNGDYQLHALFEILFPGYENAGFYRDERGFDPPSPFGEIADVLFGDVRGAVLNRYAAAVILSSVELTLELYSKLKAYVCSGGKIIVFIDMVHRYAGLSEYDPGYLGFFGIKELYCDHNGKYIVQPSQSAAAEKGILKNSYEKGSVIVALDGDGLAAEDLSCKKENQVNSPISQPYCFTSDVRELLESEFNDLRLIGVSNKNLRYCVDISKAGEDGENEYTLYIANSRFCTEHFDIVSQQGSIVKAQRLDIPDDANKCEEYLPLLREDDVGSSFGTYAIGLGDCQIWRISAVQKPLDVYPESLPAAPKKTLFLQIEPCPSIKDYLLDHPTFHHHFKGVMVAAGYFERLDKNAAEKEAHYLKLQKVKLMVDFSGMINHFPDLSLIWNVSERSDASVKKITEILDKARLYGAKAAIFTSQRLAENEYTEKQGIQGLKKSFEQIERICAERAIAMYVQNRPDTLLASGEIRKIAAHYAVNTAYAQAGGYDCAEDLPFSSLLLLSASMSDKFGQCYAANKPVYTSAAKDELKTFYDIAVEKNIPVVTSASYKNWDEVICDLMFLNEGKNWSG